MVTVLPVSAGFGVTDTALIVGGLSLMLTTTVCSVTLPALSVATTLMVFVPTIPVISFENVPFSPIVIAPTDVPLSVAVMTTGEDVSSLVLPERVIFVVFCLPPLVGDVMTSVGGIVSILKATESDVLLLPS